MTRPGHEEDRPRRLSDPVPRELLAALKTLRQAGLDPTVTAVTTNPPTTRRRAS